MAAIALDRHSFTPLYAQLVDQLASLIRAGEVAPGSSFLSERELESQYGVSRITARRVLSELSREGLIERRNGVGTFVRIDAARKRLAFLTFEYRSANQPGHRQRVAAMGALMGGIGQAVWEAGAALSLAYARQSADLLAWLDQLATDRSADGILLQPAGDLHREDVERLDRAGVPYVILKRTTASECAAHLLVDERAGIREVTAHLVALGHRSIAFVGWTRAASLHEEHVRGYKEALATAALPVDPRLIVDVPEVDPESGDVATEALLRGAAGVRPTAIVLAAEVLALGAYTAARRLGVSIPDDVSVAALGGNPEARSLHPNLTSARMDHVEVGLEGTRLLLSAIGAAWSRRRLETRNVVLTPRFEVGESTARPSSRRV
jgi:DNA-binding LacI/PurR family transcriptional regulator